MEARTILLEWLPHCDWYRDALDEDCALGAADDNRIVVGEGRRWVS